MDKVIIKIGLLVFVAAILVSCTSSKLAVEEVTHQRYVLSKTSNGSKIDVFVKDVPKNVEFKSLVFNRQQVPVSQEKWGDNGIKLTGVIQAGEMAIANAEQEYVDLPNQLNYSVDGKSSYYLLHDMNFLPTKISPRFSN